MKLNFCLFIFLSLAFSLHGQDDLQDWYHKAPSDGYMGVSVYKTYEELLKGKESQPVIVAIIDSGVDIEHEDLVDNIWTNLDEIPGNNIDDDRNGYVDDVHGWNFIGGPGGKNVGADTYEVTRLYGKYKYKFENANPALLSKSDKQLYEQFLVWKKEVESKRAAATKNLEEIKGVETTVLASLNALSDLLTDKELPITLENINTIESDDQMITIGKNIANDFLQPGETYTKEAIENMLKEALGEDMHSINNQLEYAYNPDFDPRSTIVKDNYADSNEKYYGNNDVEGPDALHGTHVAGIVAAVRNNNIGMDGIADNVLIMSVRTVPDGDERDKDVANAIRYAVDNGASIINMSFGKGYSWDKKVVDDAVKYAVKNDVLLVHAAGNSAQNNDDTGNFPNDKYDKASGFLFWKKRKASTWMEIGALSYKPAENSVAPFSNYGKENVDVFSPGMKIYATLPNDEYRYLQGTSMAAPVVAGIATVLRSYFPSLSAQQVKDIIMESANPLDLKVIKPGDKDGDKVDFKSLSVTGGVANLYNAVLLASKTKGKKKVKPMKKVGA